MATVLQLLMLSKRWRSMSTGRHTMITANPTLFCQNHARSLRREPCSLWWQHGCLFSFRNREGEIYIHHYLSPYMSYCWSSLLHNESDADLLTFYFDFFFSCINIICLSYPLVLFHNTHGWDGAVDSILTPLSHGKTCIRRNYFFKFSVTNCSVNELV